MPDHPNPLRAFKSAVAGLKRRRKFTPYRESFALANKVQATLNLLDEVDVDPCEGVELTFEFFRTDESVIGTCDDSSGRIADVYTRSAVDALARFAADCPDKHRLADDVIVLVDEDDYGVRGDILNAVGRFIPEEEIRRMVAEYESRPPDDSPYTSFRLPVEVFQLARVLKDGALMERLHRRNDDALPRYACMQIAETYLDGGDPQTALEWLERTPPDPFREYEKQELLLRAYEALGRTDDQNRILWERFRASPSLEKFHALLERTDIQDHDERDELLAREVERIAASDRWSLTDARFLLDTGFGAAAESHVLRLRDGIYGGDYHHLPGAAQRFADTGHPLAATIIYRALLTDLLEEARYRAYGHGARYLKTLDTLADRISDWGDVEPHAEFMTGLRAAHGRKSSFWKRYE